MHNSCPFGGTCWVSCLLLCAGWLLGSSALLWVTWNKVVCTLTKMKEVKFWQPALVLLTICVLCMPCAMRGKGCCKKDKGECPYESKAAAVTPEVK